MKFSYKILFCSIITMAAAFGIGGYFFVNDVFRASLNREISQAMDESSILQFAFETAALNIPSKYDKLQNSAIEEIGANLERSSQSTGRLLRLSAEDQTVLYAGDGFVQAREEHTDTEDPALLSVVNGRTRAYQVIRYNGRYYVQTGTQVNALDRVLYLETMQDVTEVYEERARGLL